ncbi:MAG: SGNH/GDSL hydrolase family protein [Deltaproteobacteria bacterium]|nr:SGNH/GDSL hydrolase family protein [Deltaproteobacteria bacterium]
MVLTWATLAHGTLPSLWWGPSFEYRKIKKACDKPASARHRGSGQMVLPETSIRDTQMHKLVRSHGTKKFSRLALVGSCLFGMLAVGCGEGGSKDDSLEDVEVSTSALTTSVGTVAIDYQMYQGTPVESMVGLDSIQRPPFYRIVLDGCGSHMPGRTIQTYMWEATPAGITGLDLNARNVVNTEFVAKAQTTTCRSPVFGFTSLNNVTVKLTLVATDGVQLSETKRLYPKDILVVSMGDSFASGEGNPDTRAPFFALPAKWANSTCHRSALSSHVLAARKLEDQDPHSVVTLFSTTCSGASITNGLLGSQSRGASVLWPQVDQIRTAMSNVGRQVDVLLLSIGGNDLGFSSIIVELAKGNTPNVTSKLAELPSRYDQLAVALREKIGVTPNRVFVSEYPDMLRRTDGYICNEVVFKDGVSDHEYVPDVLGIDASIPSSRLLWAHEQVVVPLNRTIRDRSSQHGWSLVGGIVETMSRNGYCTPASTRMVRTYDESKAIQHDISGTFHPNEAGHRAAADLIFNRVQQSLSGKVPPAVSFQANTGALWVVENGLGTDTRLGMMPGTVPSSATLPNGVAVVAFQANTSSLYIKKGNVITNTGLGMLPGTSPSLTLLPNGQVAVAFQANTNQLWTWTEAAGARNLGYGMRPGTSPSIASNLNGNLSIAFQANTGTLWKWTEGLGGNNVGAGMKADTSPSLGILPDGQLAIAFQGFTGSLATWINGTLTDIRLGMMPGTSPSLRILPGGQNPIGIAFQANTSSLWLYKPAGSSPASSFNSGLGMNPKASPVLDVMGDGSTQIAMQANTNSLWLVTNTTPVDMRLGMAAL